MLLQKYLGVCWRISFQLFERFHCSLHIVVQSAYTSFVSKLEESARLHLRRQLEANTSQFTLNALMERLLDLKSSSKDLSLSLTNQVDLEDGKQTPGAEQVDAVDDPGALQLHWAIHPAGRRHTHSVPLVQVTFV